MKAIFIGTFFIFSIMNISSAETLSGERCHVNAMQKLYDQPEIDKQVQDLRRIQEFSNNEAEIRKAIQSEDRIHYQLTDIALEECNEYAVQEKKIKNDSRKAKGDIGTSNSSTNSSLNRTKSK